MFKKGSLKANVASMFSANLLYALSSWAQLSLVAKFLDGITLGNYTLAIAIVTPLYLLTNMQLRSLIITDNVDQFSFSQYYSFRLISNVILLLVVLLIGIYIGDVFIIGLFALSKIIESNSDIINSYFQKQETMHYVTKSVSYRSIGGFLGMAIGVVIFNDIIIGLSLSVLFTGAAFILYDKRHAIKKGVYHFEYIINKQILLKMFKVAFPLGVVIFLISLNTNVSKFVLEKYVGTELQGIYSSVSYLIILGTFVCNAVGQSFAPRLSKYFGNREFDKFKSLQKKFILFNLGIGIVTIIASVVLGEFILRLLFNEEISKYTKLFTYITIVGLGNYLATALGYTLTAMREFKIQPKINFLIFILKLSIIFYFVNHYGIYGAVYSSIITLFIQNIIVYFYINMKLKKVHDGT
ncbi:lipopolysaccharide biosynthesis protein [Myroides odoratus]